jgi:D-tagatose-1,6-bisphosphate aldolase subunit GatZ/KbaZ
MEKMNPLQEIVEAQHKGFEKGIYSVCSSNPYVINALFEYELDSGNYVLIESTSNQVNQYGGYTGKNAQQFADSVHEMAQRVGFPIEQIILGGDHLGPNVWRNEPTEEAMRKSCELVASCISAGYSKIHLDASMKLADDDAGCPLDPKIAAHRAAQMCKACEDRYQSQSELTLAPCYIIGTEVPVPGGVVSGDGVLSITNPTTVKQTLEISQQAFEDLGLADAWGRVVGLVVQPGVEYGDSSLDRYDRVKTTQLVKFIENYKNLVYEAHSTDYQTKDALRQMVQDHFAILKVGPALTYAFREAIFALDMMEQEWLAGKDDVKLVNIRALLDEEMLSAPASWEKYFEGDPQYLQFARKYSYSDRSRYYWDNPKLQNAVQALINNLSQHPLPETLISQFMPCQYRKIIEGQITNHPLSLIYDRIIDRFEDYAYACGDGRHSRKATNRL